jgi:hypothetical protein
MTARAVSTGGPEKSRKPTHRIYAVEKPSDPNGRGYWSPIGAAWQHEDGDGFSLKLQLLPLGGQDLVIRKIKPKTDTTTEQTIDEDIPY